MIINYYCAMVMYGKMKCQVERCHPSIVVNYYQPRQTIYTSFTVLLILVTLELLRVPEGLVCMLCFTLFSVIFLYLKEKVLFVAQAGSKVGFLLPQISNCWKYRHVPPYMCPTICFAIRVLTSTINKKNHINRERKLSANELQKSERPIPIGLLSRLHGFPMKILLKWKKKRTHF